MWGRALPEGARLTLADTHRCQISYRGGTGKDDVTLARADDLAPTPGPLPTPIANPAPQWATLATPALAAVAVQRGQGGQVLGATLTFNGPVNLDPRAASGAPAEGTRGPGSVQADSDRDGGAQRPDLGPTPLPLPEGRTARPRPLRPVRPPRPDPARPDRRRLDRVGGGRPHRDPL